MLLYVLWKDMRSDPGRVSEELINIGGLGSAILRTYAFLRIRSAPGLFEAKSDPDPE